MRIALALATLLACFDALVSAQGPNAAVPRDAHTLFGTKSGITVFGGRAGTPFDASNQTLVAAQRAVSTTMTTVQLADLSVANPITNDSTTTGANPLGYHSQSCGYRPAANTIHCFGGQSPLTRNATNNLFSLDLNSMSWTVRQIPEISPRHGAGSAILGDLLYIYGGRSGDTQFSDMYAIPLTTTNPPSSIKSPFLNFTDNNCVAAISQTQLYLHAGTMLKGNQSFHHFESYIFDSTTSEITDITRLVARALKPRTFFSCASDTEGYVYLFGGLDNLGTMMNDLWRLDLQTGQWKELWQNETQSGLFDGSGIVPGAARGRLFPRMDLVGKYAVIHGGSVLAGPSTAFPIDPSFYFFDTANGKWVNASAVVADASFRSASFGPPAKGRFTPSTTNPLPSSGPQPTLNPQVKNETPAVSTGGIVGAVVGGLAGVGLAAAVILRFTKHRHQRNTAGTGHEQDAVVVHIPPPGLISGKETGAYVEKPVFLQKPTRFTWRAE